MPDQLAHDFQDQRDGRGVIVGRQCSRCDLWENADTSTSPCHRPKMRILGRRP